MQALLAKGADVNEMGFGEMSFVVGTALMAASGGEVSFIWLGAA